MEEYCTQCDSQWRLEYDEREESTSCQQCGTIYTEGSMITFN